MNLMPTPATRSDVAYLDFVEGFREYLLGSGANFESRLDSALQAAGVHELDDICRFVHEQPLGHAREGEADLEGVLGDAEVPELVLEDDGHVLRVLLAKRLLHAHARGLGAERDVEMVLAHQPVPGRVGQIGRAHV